MKNRVVRPEILDSLSPDHPAAVANRRDLQRINRLMGTSSWIASTLERWHVQGDHIFEAGAGDGELGRFLRRRLPDLRGGLYTGLDLSHTRPADWPASWAWHRGDLLDHAFARRPHVLIANFLLHQFTDADLARLGRTISEIPVWIICEPARSRLALAGLAALRPFGLHSARGGGHSEGWPGQRAGGIPRAGAGGSAGSRCGRAADAGRHRLAGQLPSGVRCSGIARIALLTARFATHPGILAVRPGWWSGAGGGIGQVDGARSLFLINNELIHGPIGRSRSVNRISGPTRINWLARKGPC